MRANRSRALTDSSGTGSARTVIGTSTTRATASATRLQRWMGRMTRTYVASRRRVQCGPSDVTDPGPRLPPPREPDLPAPGVGIGEPQERRNDAQSADGARHQQERQRDLDDDGGRD